MDSYLLIGYTPPETFKTDYERIYLVYSFFTNRIV